MATIPRELVRQTWASLAISVMWLAVLFDALFGPDLVFSGNPGTGTTTIRQRCSWRCSHISQRVWSRSTASIADRDGTA